MAMQMKAAVFVEKNRIVIEDKPIPEVGPLDAFSAGLGDHRIVTSLCPGGKERMRRLMSIVASGRLDTSPLVTHRFRLEQIEQAYEMFANQRDGVVKVAMTP